MISLDALSTELTCDRFKLPFLEKAAAARRFVYLRIHHSFPDTAGIAIWCDRGPSQYTKYVYETGLVDYSHDSLHELFKSRGYPVSTHEEVLVAIEANLQLALKWRDEQLAEFMPLTDEVNEISAREFELAFMLAVEFGNGLPPGSPVEESMCHTNLRIVVEDGCRVWDAVTYRGSHDKTRAYELAELARFDGVY